MTCINISAGSGVSLELSAMYVGIIKNEFKGSISYNDASIKEGDAFFIYDESLHMKRFLESQEGFTSSFSEFAKKQKSETENQQKELEHLQLEIKNLKDSLRYNPNVWNNHHT